MSYSVKNKKAATPGIGRLQGTGRCAKDSPLLFFSLCKRRGREREGGTEEIVDGNDSCCRNQKDGLFVPF